jgi:hypothetical protein
MFDTKGTGCLTLLWRFVGFVTPKNVARITNTMTKSLQIINTKSMQVGMIF